MGATIFSEGVDMLCQSMTSFVVKELAGYIRKNLKIFYKIY